MPPLIDLEQILPEVIVTGVAITILGWTLFLPPTRQEPLRWLAVGGVLAALLETIGQGFPGTDLFAGMYVRDALTQVLQSAALVAALLVLGMSGDYLARTRLDAGEFYGLVLFAALGAMLMAASTDLLMLFVGFETLSIPLYVLAAFARTDRRSQEAGLKYFLLGAFSTAFFLYGIALLYGAAEGTGLRAIAMAARAPTAIFHAGVALLTIGLTFKAAVVPFHFWAPDVYEGAPLPVTAYMSVIAKVGAFAALLRVFIVALSVEAARWTPLLGAASVLTMLLGNLAALRQTSIKRLLAYSSIAHAGYILTGVAAGTPAGAAAVVFYLVAYTFMTLGAFGVVLMLEREGHEADQIMDLAGVAWQKPALGVAMTVFMISLAGFPLTIGFLAKLYVFTAVLDRGQVGVAVVGLLTSVVSAYYYLRVAYLMFVGQPQAGVGYAGGRWGTAVLVVCAVAVLGGGLFPAPLTAFAQQVVHGLR